MENNKYDLVILGGGPAGLTAAIYAARYHMNFIVISEGFGGTITGALEVENWPGKIASGTEIMNEIKKQADFLGTEYIQEKVDKIERKDKDYIIFAGEKKILTKSIIYALGTKHRCLNIPGEEEYKGKGVSYCATCDGRFFRNKTVAVIGGANSAAEGALYLADICENVYIIYRKDRLRCEPGTLELLEKKSNVEIIYNALPTLIKGESLVQFLEITQKDKKRFIPTKGIFIEIGADAVTDPLYGLDVKIDQGYVYTNKNTETNLPGLFAAGDVTNNLFKQMVTATGEGATAVASAFNYIRFKYR